MLKQNERVSAGVRLMTLTALLSAVALVLSVLENMLPDLPFAVPGMKLGLSNIALMFSLELCPLPCSFAIVLVKAGFALISRGAVAGLMSLAGGVPSALVMWLLIRSKRIGFGALGVGVAGAFLHNMGQLFVAFFLVSDAVCGYFPVLSILALLTGSATALTYYIVMPVLKKLPIVP